MQPASTRLRYDIDPRVNLVLIDKVQVRHDVATLAIPPHSGILTSCSMYLKEHYVVLNPGEGNFGLHTSAILLDPIKTFGTNIMLEIYNTGDQPVVNPMLTVEVFRAPPFADPEFKTLQKKRQRLLTTALAAALPAAAQDGATTQRPPCCPLSNKRHSDHLGNRARMFSR